MSTPVVIPEPEISPEPIVPEPPKPRRKVFLKWSLGATALFFAYLAWQCGSTLMQAKRLVGDAAGRFHQQFNSAEYEQIYAEADLQGDQRNRSEFIKYLSAVHAKIGDFRSLEITNFVVKASAETTVTAECNSSFAKGTAHETFVWTKENGKLRLTSYNIQSKAFLFNQ